MAPNGTIYRNGKQIGYTKKSEGMKRGTQYRYIKYKGKELKIHRIVYQKFHGDLSSDMVVHHIDGNSLNNRWRNLFQTTQQGNMFYRNYKFIKCED